MEEMAFKRWPSETLCPSLPAPVPQSLPGCPQQPCPTTAEACLGAGQSAFDPAMHTTVSAHNFTKGQSISDTLLKLFSKTCNVIYQLINTSMFA